MTDAVGMEIVGAIRGLGSTFGLLCFIILFKKFHL